MFSIMKQYCIVPCMSATGTTRIIIGYVVCPRSRVTQMCSFFDTLIQQHVPIDELYYLHTSPSRRLGSVNPTTSSTRTGRCNGHSGSRR